jgi:hypothetical protein
MVDRRRPDEGEEKPRGRELLEDPGEALRLDTESKEGMIENEKRNRASYITRPSSDSLGPTYCAKVLAEVRRLVMQRPVVRWKRIEAIQWGTRSGARRRHRWPP